MLGFALPDAEDRAQPGLDRARELARDTGVVVALVATHLGVPDDRSRGEALEQRGRELSRVRAAPLPVDVLRVDADVAVAQGLGDGGERDRRRRDPHSDAVVTMGGDRPSELHRVGDRGRVHLPVPDDQALAH